MKLARAALMVCCAWVPTFMGSIVLASSPTVTPEACAAASKYSDAHAGVAVLVLVDGKAVCETGATDKAFELWSGTKSFVGMIAAAAVQDGLLTLDERVADTIPEWRNDELKQQVTIRQLLSMTSGQPSRIGRPTGYEAAAALPVTIKPGSAFNYGPTPTEVFGAVMARKLAARGLRENPVEYLDRRVLKPAGISCSGWRTGPDDNPLLPQGAILTAHQWARYGELIRHAATVEGRALVDTGAFQEMFVGSEANPAYGLAWWLPRRTQSTDPVTAQFELAHNPQIVPADMVIAAGAGEQRLYVIPSLGVTIVRQAKLNLASRPGPNEPRWEDSKFLQLLGIADMKVATNEGQ